MPCALMQGDFHLEGWVTFFRHRESGSFKHTAHGLLSTQWGHLFLIVPPLGGPFSKWHEVIEQVGQGPDSSGLLHGGGRKGR